MHCCLKNDNTCGSSLAQKILDRHLEQQVCCLLELINLLEAALASSTVMAGDPVPANIAALLTRIETFITENPRIFAINADDTFTILRYISCVCERLPFFNVNCTAPGSGFTVAAIQGLLLALGLAVLVDGVFTLKTFNDLLVAVDALGPVTREALFDFLSELTGVPLPDPATGLQGLADYLTAVVPTLANIVFNPITFLELIDLLQIPGATLTITPEAFSDLICCVRDQLQAVKTELSLC